MNVKQYSFSEMSRKQVVNVADGAELGHVCDLIFSNCGRVLGIVVPGCRRGFFKSITSGDSLFVPWNRIIKIGSDVVLVEICGINASTCEVPNENANDCNAENCYTDEK
ncbi:MAG: YlmC/YmxH family sporulation protein [Clostridia bacterium]